ncbi:MAG TPA: tetratricopeptide repeat protein [Gammaproteobacteria bacterium]|nr:tetratricopeptide repeat protein [Gammaproteobacteria bacterium]
MDDRSVIPRRLFAFARPLGAAAMLPLLAACQTAPVSTPEEPSAGQTPADVTEQAQTPYQGALQAFLTAEIARQRGRMQEAGRWYARAASMGGRVPLYADAVDAALRAQEGAEAEEYATAWREAAPQAPQPLFGLARARLQQGDREGAVAAFTQLVDDHPGEDALYLSAGEQLAEVRSIQAAVAVLRQVAEDRPESAVAQAAYGHLLARLGRRDPAAEALRNALSLRPDWEAAAVELARTRRVEEGLAILRKFLADYPEADQARLRYAQGLLATGRAAEAEKVFALLAERVPERVEVQMGLGLARFRQQQWDGAEAAFRQALGQDPGNAGALFHLGRVAEQRGRYREAMAYYSRVEGGAFRERARMREAVAAVQLGELQRALRLVRQMRSFHPGESAYYRLEARILAQMGQLSAAEQVANQGLQKHPDAVQLLYARAVIREQQGDYAGMEADIRRVMEQQPEDAKAYNFLGYSLADRGVRLKEALRLLQKANELAPEQGYILDSLGWVHYRLGRLDKAEQLLRRALERTPGDAEILAHLGEVLEAQGRQEAARGIWRKALEQAGEETGLAQELRRRLEGDVP